MKTKNKPKQKFWRFTYGRIHQIKGKKRIEGVVMFGEGCDHFSAMKAINGFLGEDVVELNGSGIGVNLFLPKSKLDAWQKLALFDEAWEKTDSDEQKGGLDLELLKKHTKAA